VQGVANLECNLTVSPGQLKRFLPDIYWANLFGLAYVEHFGKERLLSTPAETVEEWPNDGVYIRLSDNPMDFVNDYAQMQAIRNRIKDHLGDELV